MLRSITPTSEYPSVPLSTRFRRLIEQQAYRYGYDKNPEEATHLGSTLKTARNERSFFGTRLAEDTNVVLLERPKLRARVDYDVLAEHLSFAHAMELLPRSTQYNDSSDAALPFEAVTQLANETNGVVRDAVVQCRDDLLMLKQKGYNGNLFMRNNASKTLHTNGEGEYVVSSLANAKLSIPAARDVTMQAGDRMPMPPPELLAMLIQDVVMPQVVAQALASGKMEVLNGNIGIMIIGGPETFDEPVLRSGAPLFTPKVADLVRFAGDGHKKAEPLWHEHDYTNPPAVYIQARKL